MLIDTYAQRSATSTLQGVTGPQDATVLPPTPHAALLQASLVSSPAYCDVVFTQGAQADVIRAGGAAQQGRIVSSAKPEAPALGVPPRGSTG
jgi:hypothetical protein